jgi:hypothetical protein
VGGNRFEPSLFQVRDIAPLGYAVFACALGVAAGVLTRRTLPAMAVTLGAYIGVRVVEMVWIRPHFIAPLTFTASLDTAAAKQRGASGWILGQTFTDPGGHTVNDLAVRGDSPCVATHSCFAGYHTTITYQPADRYWTFQWYETELFVAVSAALIALCYWWLRRRLV